jgi:VanZ family protein
MRKNAVPLLQRVFWTLYVLALVVSSLMPVAFVHAPDNSDKVMHALAYCLLVLLWPPAWRRPLPVMFGFAVGLGLALEVAQGLLPTGRYMDIWDALANTIGAALGLALVLACRRFAARQR